MAKGNGYFDYFVYFRLNNIGARLPVVSMQSCFDTKSFRYKVVSIQSRFDAKLFRYKVVSIQSRFGTGLFFRGVNSS